MISALMCCFQLHSVWRQRTGAVTAPPDRLRSEQYWLDQLLFAAIPLGVAGSAWATRWRRRIGEWAWRSCCSPYPADAVNWRASAAPWRKLARQITMLAISIAFDAPSTIWAIWYFRVPSICSAEALAAYTAAAGHAWNAGPDAGGHRFFPQRLCLPVHRASSHDCIRQGVQASACLVNQHRAGSVSLLCGRQMLEALFLAEHLRRSDCGATVSLLITAGAEDPGQCDHRCISRSAPRR